MHAIMSIDSKETIQCLQWPQVVPKGIRVSKRPEIGAHPYPYLLSPSDIPPNIHTNQIQKVLSQISPAVDQVERAANASILNE